MHEGRSNCSGLPTLLDDYRPELEARVDVEDLVAILETEEPFPAAALKEQLAQIRGALVGVDPRGHEHADAPAILCRESMRQLQEHLVGVDVG